MILADTSIWIAFLKGDGEALQQRLRDTVVLMHPFVVGELLLGSLKDRPGLMQFLGELTPAVVSSHDEVVALIEAEKLFARGIGYVDVHLLASVRLTPGARLLTRDKRLNVVADRLGLAA